MNIAASELKRGDVVIREVSQRTHEVESAEVNGVLVLVNFNDGTGASYNHDELLRVQRP